VTTRVGGNRQSSLALTCGMHMKNAGTNHASANKATIRSESVVKHSVEECRGTGYHNGNSLNRVLHSIATFSPVPA